MNIANKSWSFDKVLKTVYFKCSSDSIVVHTFNIVKIDACICCWRLSILVLCKFFCCLVLTLLLFLFPWLGGYQWWRRQMVISGFGCVISLLPPCHSRFSSLAVEEAFHKNPLVVGQVCSDRQAGIASHLEREEAELGKNCWAEWKSDHATDRESSYWL